MKVLLLVQRTQRVILDRLYQGIADCCDCDVRHLDSDEQAELAAYFAQHVDVASYQRIVMFTRFKQIRRQVRFLATVPNLVLLEHDAYQNYAESKYRGKYSKFHRALPWVRVIASGHAVAGRLRQEGADAVFVPKGYDQALLQNLGRERGTELAFVGSTGSRVYSGRKEFLEALARREQLQMVRTQSGSDYLDKLNDIRFFVSADIDMGEYMIKNFEAMACGCVLFAYDQGDDENQALGFRDMENLVLYRDLDEFCEKLRRLRADPALADRIAAAGQQLVEERYTFQLIGERVVAALQPPLRKPSAPQSWLARLGALLR